MTANSVTIDAAVGDEMIGDVIVAYETGGANDDRFENAASEMEKGVIVGVATADATA